MRRLTRSILIAASLVMLFSGFTITCLPVGGSKGIDLGVPMRAKAQGTRQCAAACVQMLRLWCGCPEDQTQEFIHSKMGGTSTGVHYSKIPFGVRYFTCISDAAGHLYSEMELQQELAKQIASINSGWPFIALTQGMFHAVVVRGGQYFRDSTGKYKWVTVYINDPDHLSFDRVEVPAHHWTGGRFEVAFSTPGYATFQVLSTAAIGNWQYYLAEFGGAVTIWNPVDGGEPENQM